MNSWKHSPRGDARSTGTVTRTRNPPHAEAVDELSSVCYAVRAIATIELGRVHTVGPLKGCGAQRIPVPFIAGEKSAWTGR